MSAATVKGSTVGSRTGRLALVALVAGLLAACAAVPGADDPIDVNAGGPGGALGKATAPPVASGPARPSAGCTKGAGGGPDETGPFNGPRTLTVGAKQRTYLLHVPASAAAGKAAPLVLDLHGLGTDANLQANATDWNGLADREGVIVAHPQGLDNVWNYAPEDANPDIAYLRALTQTLQGERCIDLSRTYATGISMGSLLVSAMACKSPDLFAAIGLVAGIQWKPECAAAPPRPVMVMWGSKDCTLPWYGGLGPCLAVGPPRTQPTAPLPPGQDMGFPPVDTVLAEWLRHEGCSPEPELQMVSQTIALTRYPKCKPNAAVELYYIEGGSHTWPGSKLFIQLETNLTPEARESRGTTTADLDATKVIWEFFRAHQLPGS